MGRILAISILIAFLGVLYSTENLIIQQEVDSFRRPGITVLVRKSYFWLKFEILPINCIFVELVRKVGCLLAMAVDAVDWSFTVKEVGLKLVHVAYYVI
jgi:hypothetical protein